MKRIILSVTNDLGFDQRVHRIATTLINNKAKVTLVGRLLPDSLPLQRNYNTYRMRLLFKKGPLFYAEYNIRLFFYLLFARVDILVSNDLDTLLANYLVSIIRRKVLVYDAHEYFTEVPELIGRNLVKKIWKKIEQLFLPQIKYSYTVCQSIADVYNRQYDINMKVVRNLPMRFSEVNLNFCFTDIPITAFVIYQGSINLGRGLELLVDSFEYINEIKCVIVGEGDVLDVLKKRVIIKKLEDKIIFTGKLPYHNLKTITPRAAIGISIEENLGMNYYYALPNKLFDYIQAGIPVLVSDFPEMRGIVYGYSIGEILRSREPKELAKQIDSMIKADTKVLWKQNLAKAAEELCWEKEEEILLKIYEKIL